MWGRLNGFLRSERFYGSPVKRLWIAIRSVGRPGRIGDSPSLAGHHRHAHRRIWHARASESLRPWRVLYAPPISLVEHRRFGVHRGLGTAARRPRCSEDSARSSHAMLSRSAAWNISATLLRESLDLSKTLWPRGREREFPVLTSLEFCVL